MGRMVLLGKAGYPLPRFSHRSHKFGRNIEKSQRASQRTAEGRSAAPAAGEVIKERNNGMKKHLSLHALCARNKNRRGAGAVSVR